MTEIARRAGLAQRTFFRHFAAELQERGEYARQCQAVIAANPELQERELPDDAGLAWVAWRRGTSSGGP